MHIEADTDSAASPDEPPERSAADSGRFNSACMELADRASRPAAPSPAPRFTQSPRSQFFRRVAFPDATASDWNNWHWQLQNTLRSVDEIGRIVDLTPAEREAMAGPATSLPTAVTPYYSSLLDPTDPAQPLRRTMIPVPDELLASPGEDADPLHEDEQSPTPGLIHRYPDRVLFMATEYCSAYCRYCTRSRLVGHVERTRYCCSQWEKAISYIEATPAIRDVIVSGGDPLTLPDEPLEWLLMKLRAIRHVEVIRIGSKTPAVLPMRVTASLVKILKKCHPLWVSLHFTHPDELTPETKEACERLADAGVPLGSQTVLLKGVNDNATVMKRLMTGLMAFRVRPYYLYQCDPIIGSAHFRTPIATGLEMIKSLRGHVSGYAVPQYVVDAPGGGGKIPLLPKYSAGHRDGSLVLKNYQDREFRYPDLG